MAKVKPIPEGMHSVTPHILVRGAAKAIEFYKNAFGAQEISRSPTPDGRLMHAMIRVGDSFIFLADEFPEMGGAGAPTPGQSPVVLHLYVEDADATWSRAISAGAKPKMPLTDMFWGDRYGQLNDPFGHTWALATHKEDVSPDEMQRRAQAAFSAPR
jgi:PhnB protein